MRLHDHLFLLCQGRRNCSLLLRCCTRRIFDWAEILVPGAPASVVYNLEISKLGRRSPIEEFIFNLVELHWTLFMRGCIIVGRIC